MPLHRDIHWIGRQWAVTGHGVQLIDQKLQGFFDVEVSKLWDDVLIEAMHARDWLNAADFEKAIAVARARYPEPASAQSTSAVTALREVVPPPVIEPVAPPSPMVESEAPKLEKREAVEPPRAPVALKSPSIAQSLPPEPRPNPPTLFRMRYEGRARFVRPWRVVARKF